jgi:HEAT repeat protein
MSSKDTADSDRAARIVALVVHLNSEDEGDAKRAAELLDELLYPRYDQPCVVTVDYDIQLHEAHHAALRGKDALNPLLETAQRGTIVARTYSLVVLAIIGESRAFALAIDSLRDPHPKIRQAATRSLWFFRNVDAVPPLIETLGDPDVDVRSGAASALGFIGSIQSVPALMALYTSGIANDQASAIHALGDLCDPRSLSLVRDSLQNKCRDVRKAAKYALSQFDRKRREATS